MIKKERLLFAAMLLGAMSLTSCRKGLLTDTLAGVEVAFNVSTLHCEETKVSYSGTQSADKAHELINWDLNDLIRIYCPQASRPESKFADYILTELSGNKARIITMGGSGLHWGGSEAHSFYGVYPSPEVAGIATGISSNIVSASLPSVQGMNGMTDNVIAPDMTNMLMTSKSVVPEGSMGRSDVQMNFMPMTTAIGFTIKNTTGGDLSLKYVSLISGNGEATAPALNGAFTVDLDNVSRPSDVKPFEDSDFTVTYSDEYPACSGTGSTSDLNRRIVLINFGGESGEESVTISEGGTLEFTFFLVPTHDFQDLTFKLGKSDGTWMSTRLKYADDSGIFFPKYKKTSMSGVLVPDGAVWRVSYVPGVTPWDGEGGDIYDAQLHEEELMGPFATTWEKGDIDNIDLIQLDSRMVVIRWRTGDVDDATVNIPGSNEDGSVSGWGSGRNGDINSSSDGTNEDGSVSGWGSGRNGDINSSSDGTNESGTVSGWESGDSGDVGTDNSGTSEGGSVSGWETGDSGDLNSDDGQDEEGTLEDWEEGNNEDLDL